MFEKLAISLIKLKNIKDRTSRADKIYDEILDWKNILFRKNLKKVLNSNDSVALLNFSKKYKLNPEDVKIFYINYNKKRNALGDISLRDYAKERRNKLINLDSVIKKLEGNNYKDTSDLIIIKRPVKKNTNEEIKENKIKKLPLILGIGGGIGAGSLGTYLIMKNDKSR